MPNNHILTRSYHFLKGISTDSLFARQPNVATEALNMQRLPDTSFGSRRGYQALAANIGGLGVGAGETGPNDTAEIICIHRDGNLYKLVPSFVSLTYSGATFVNFSLFVNPKYIQSATLGWGFDPWSTFPWGAQTIETMTFELAQSGITLIDQNLGKGYDTVTIMTVNDLIAVINATPGAILNATTTGDGTVPAAFITLIENQLLSTGQTYQMTYFYWVPVNRTITPTFPGSVSHMGSPNFEIASFAAYGDIIFISNGYDYPQKFDGQTVYRAGMPQGGTPVPVAGGVGILNGTYQYSITYEQIDAKGNVVQGTISQPASITVVNRMVSLTINNLQAGSGWNTDGAEVGGAPVVSVVTGTGPYFHTFAVPNASLKVGDTAFYFDVTSAALQQDLVTAVTLINFTVQRATATPVTLAASSAVSNNLKIHIWRTQAGGTIPHLLITIPNDSFAPTRIYIDNKADADLGEPYAEPVRQPDPPPISRYLVAYGNQIIYSGDPIHDDYVWFSEPENPEYVPAAFNFFIVPPNDDDVSGLGVAGTTLIVGKDRSIYAVMGDLVNGQFTVKPVSPGQNIGISAHATIRSVGGLLYFLDDNGVYSIAESQIFPTDPQGNPIPLSSTIDLVFRQVPFFPEQKFVFKRATAWNYTKDQQYWLFLPCENTGQSVDDANQFSRVFCYDYEGKNWFPWSNINAAGGFVEIGDDIWWQERRFSGSIGSTANTYRQNRYYRLIDYADHVSAIFVNWLSSWEDVGQPRMRKKFVRAVLLISPVSSLQQYNNPIMQFNSYTDWFPDLSSTQSYITTADNPSNWNNGFWSWSKWGGYQDSFITINLKNGTVAKAIQIGFTMQRLNTTFHLQGFQLEVVPAFRKTVLR